MLLEELAEEFPILSKETILYSMQKYAKEHELEIQQYDDSIIIRRKRI